MDLDGIRQGYDGHSSTEWDRLQTSPITRIEYLITSYCLEQHLPRKGLVLDAGSGPGRYAIDLAQRGCRVVAFDLVREMLRLAQDRVLEAGVARGVVGMVEGDIAALPFSDGAFDAIVSLGAPLSHLTRKRARRRAVEDMARVAKPGGWVIVSGLMKYAFYRSAIYWSVWYLFDSLLASDVSEGSVMQGSHVWYGFAPGELEDLVQRAGLVVVDRVGCEGLAAQLSLEHLAQVESDPERWPRWREVLLETCNEPTIIGHSNHLLVVCRKPTGWQDGRARVTNPGRGPSHTC